MHAPVALYPPPVHASISPGIPPGDIGGGSLVPEGIRIGTPGVRRGRPQGSPKAGQVKTSSPPTEGHPQRFPRGVLLVAPRGYPRDTPAVPRGKTPSVTPGGRRFPRGSLAITSWTCQDCLDPPSSVICGSTILWNGASTTRRCGRCRKSSRW